MRDVQFAFFTNPIIQYIMGGLFALKQWISSSLKHDTVQRVNNLNCFYAKSPQKRIALWDGENNRASDVELRTSY